MLAILCPGQGSQTPGFLQPWLDVPGVGERLDWLSAVAGLDLRTHGTTSDADTIRDTAVAQPLIVSAALATLPALGSDEGAAGGLVEITGELAAVVAGHSVGELAAAAIAGVLSPEQAVVLVRERGAAMAAASAVTATGMSAVLGGDPDEVSAAIARHGLTAANINGAGQVVAAGTLEQLAAFAADPPARARVISLQVAGAFHTHHMASAVAVLAGLARALTPQAARSRLLSNADGAQVSDGADVLARLVNQVSNPVRWDLCMRTMVDLGVSAVLELPPAGTLAGLAKRAMPGVQIVTLKTPDDLPEARALIAEHSPTPTLAPTGGTV